ncbi:MAG: (Fe-S)-binding protein [Hydrogenobacter thermophilus]|uniref:(Fe-S)-binding protein n=1 Tax=Hydrogenobacter thermophilus TaxID=940 RepID=UPI001C74AE1D|nr:(Fe-S)-binding protein [Hydrogenobacter thermophilus]QWK19699.1 MAG: (Fe-S)-binding protein [Hydrogenobacter thermophilus]
MEKAVEIPIDLAQKCVKCGLCKSVCPTYSVNQEEGSFARGRLALAQMVIEGEMPLTNEVAKQWDECAMCRRCEWICPNDVHYKEILVYAKHMQKEELGADIVKSAGLKSLELMQTKAGRKLVKLAGRIMSLLPMDEIKTPFPTGAVKFMPKPTSKAFGLRGKVFKAEEEKAKLLFFTGCMIDAFYGKTGENVVKLLNRAGYTVVVPEDIRCCGAPHYYSGNTEAFERLKDHNLKEMQKYDYDAIVVACPTCGGALQEDYGINKKVYDFTELLQDKRLRFAGKGESITFHVPCHSYSAMKVKDEVFYSVMNSVENAQLKKAQKDKSCCGFAGLFSITNPKMSDQIQKEKIEDLASTGANIVLSTCPGCVLNLKDGSIKHKTGQEVMHLADYLAERLVDEV